MKKTKSTTGNNKIAVFDMKRHYHAFKGDVDKAINRVLKNGRFILNGEVEEFEKEFAHYSSSRYAVGVASGTDAIYLALKALGIKKGDEVITQANTAIPTAMAIVKTGASLRLADVVYDDYNMDSLKLENALSSKTKAVVPVHLYGNPCKMGNIISLSKKHNFSVVEDACQAHGARYNTKAVGTFGVAGCFSFYPTKNLGCFGDGGMVITNDKTICKKLKLLRNYGQETRYNSVITGVNSRLDEIQASLLRYKLSRLEKMNRSRKHLAIYYENKLSGVGDIILPKENTNSTHVFHLYVIRTKYRDRLRKYLADRNIMTEIHYPIPLHLQKSFKYLKYKKGKFPVSEKLSKEILTLPMFPELSIKEVDRISDSIKEFFSKKYS